MDKPRPFVGQRMTADGGRAEMDPPRRRIAKENIHKGKFMTVDGPRIDALAEDRKLASEFPAFEESLQAAGSRHRDVFEKHRDAIKQLAERFEAVRREIDSYNNNNKKKR